MPREMANLAGIEHFAYSAHKLKNLLWSTLVRVFRPNGAKTEVGGRINELLWNNGCE
jgi:hypothetical protein